jgi:hypothetical protein
MGYCMLRALAITGVRRENIMMERVSGPDEGGFELVNPLWPRKPDFELAKAFRFLRRISICLQRLADPAMDRGFRTCLRAAHHLEHLVVLVTSCDDFHIHTRPQIFNA